MPFGRFARAASDGRFVEEPLDRAAQNSRVMEFRDGPVKPEVDSGDVRPFQLREALERGPLREELFGEKVRQRVGRKRTDVEIGGSLFATVQRNSLDSAL